MNVNEWLRALAGFFVILSVVLVVVTGEQRILWFTGFIGLNLLQSAFTKWCPAMFLLRKAGVKEGGSCGC